VGTHTLLECCKKRKGYIKKIIHVSTDEVYGESLGNEQKHEESLLFPTNPYAATKSAAEMIVMSYIKSYNLPIIITRGNNVYGLNQYPEKLIPRFIQQLRSDQQVTIQGDGSNVRAFLHSSDVSTALDCILTKGNVGEIYNIGSDEDKEYTVFEIAEILIKKIKKTENINEHITYIEDRPFNDKRYYISNEKVKKLGWEIKKDFMEGLDELI
jgi:UDP-glucose 4,6-dehydratase